MGNISTRVLKVVTISLSLSQVLSKDDITALKSRLQRIKKLTEDKSSAASSSSVSSSTPVNPAPTNTPPADAKTLKSTLARAKELATRAQRKEEVAESEENRQIETQSHERYTHIHITFYT